LATLLAVALAVRLYRIESESIWFDESVTYMSLDRAGPMEYFRAEAENDPLAVPVYFGSAYVWYKLGFTSVVGVRMLSVLAGMLGIVVIYFFGRRLFGHMGGMTAALCMSLAKLQIYMSQEIRNYAFTMLFAAVAMYALHEALQTGRRRWWAINVAANGLLCLTHFLAVILVFAEGVYLLAAPPRKTRRTGAWGIAHLPFLLFIPIWIHLVARDTIDDAASWIGWQPLGRAFKAYYFVFAGSLQDAMDFIRVLPFGIPVQHILGSGTMIAGAGFVAYCAWVWLRKRDSAQGYSLPSAGLLLVWLFVPPATLFIVARLVRPCFIERYVLYSALALFLVVGGALAALPKKSWQYAAFAFLAAVYAGNLVDYPRPLRYDFASTGAVLREEFAPGEHVHMCFANSLLPIQYYAGVPPEAIVGEEEFVQPAIAEALGGTRTWMWFIDVPTRWEHEKIEALMTQNGVRFKKWEFAGRWRTHLYRLEAASDPARNATT
jgi:mannosyltransferase